MQSGGKAWERQSTLRCSVGCAQACILQDGAGLQVDFRLVFPANLACPASSARHPPSAVQSLHSTRTIHSQPLCTLAHPRTLALTHTDTDTDCLTCAPHSTAPPGPPQPTLYCGPLPFTPRLAFQDTGSCAPFGRGRWPAPVESSGGRSNNFRCSRKRSRCLRWRSRARISVAACEQFAAWRSGI